MKQKESWKHKAAARHPDFKGMRAILVCFVIFLIAGYLSARFCQPFLNTDLRYADELIAVLYACGFACIGMKSCCLIRGQRIHLRKRAQKVLHAAFYEVFGITYLIFFVGMSTIPASAIGTEYNLVRDGLLKVCFALCLLLFSLLSLSEENKRRYVFQLVIAAAAAGYFFTNGNWYVFALFPLMLAATGSDSRVMIRITFFLNLGLSILFYWLSVNGYISYVVSETGYGVKHGFGFDSGNAAAMELCFLMIYFLYLVREKIKSFSSAWLVFMVLCFSLFFSNRYLKGRTGVISLAAVIALAVFYYLRKCVLNHIKAECRPDDFLDGTVSYGRRRFSPEKYTGIGVLESLIRFWHNYIVPYVYFIMTALSILICWLYRGSAADMTVSGSGTVTDMGTFHARLAFGHEVVTQYVPKLFGQYIPETTSAANYFWIDNFYIRVLYKGGILPFAVLMICMTLIMRRLAQKKDYFLMDVLAVTAVAGFLEVPMVGAVMFNVFPLMAFQRGMYEPEKLPDTKVR